MGAKNQRAAERDESVERQARDILTRVLRREVVQHDTGARDRMYDLRVGDPAAPEIAIECTGAVDDVRTQAWNVGPARGPLTCELRGDWTVVLQPTARMTRVRAAVQTLLQERERDDLLEPLRVDWRLKRENPTLFSRLDSLDIHSIDCFREHGSGTVHLGMCGIGGMVDRQGQELVGWIGRFLREPRRARKLSKLCESHALECHVFVPVSFGGAPWSVESYLDSELHPLPESSPDLPAPVSAVWITYGPNGVHWDGRAWSRFSAIVPDDSR
jgi:plasmid stability protein